MFWQILIATLVGIFLGIITGLIPGIHVNLISIILLSASPFLLRFTNVLSLAVFIISMATTHSFLDFIPGIFLGAPEAETALSVLPGHRLLLRGMGYEAVKLTVVGSLFCLLIAVIILPFLIPVVPLAYDFLKDYIGWILLAVVIYMIFIRNKGLNNKFWGFFVFMMAGILGVITLNMPNLKQPLFPLLSGLFGISILVVSLSDKVVIPKQRITEMIKVPKKNLFKALAASTFSGSLVSFFPGLGPAQAAIIGMQIVGRIGVYSFLVLVGGINTVNFIISMVTFYTIDKARNGAIVAVSEIIKNINIKELFIFVAVVLIVGGIATFLALFFARIFSEMISKVNYALLCTVVILLITILVFVFSGWLGFLVLIVATTVGIIPSGVGVSKSFSMGCLLLPVILYFLL